MAVDPRLHASEHFCWSEFACQNWQRTAYPLDWRETRGRPLANELEVIRGLICQRLGTDTPLWLTSVFRTAAWNAAVGGVASSQHLEGRAADLQCPFGCPYALFRELIIEAAHRLGSPIRFVKFYPNQGFAHIDTRPTKTLVVEEQA
jgi:uncharacterized protein YcbK (DUF882 family)